MGRAPASRWARTRPETPPGPLKNVAIGARGPRIRLARPDQGRPLMKRENSQIDNLFRPLSSRTPTPSANYTRRLLVSCASGRRSMKNGPFASGRPRSAATGARPQVGGWPGGARARPTMAPGGRSQPNETRPR